MNRWSDRWLILTTWTLFVFLLLIIAGVFVQRVTAAEVRVYHGVVHHVIDGDTVKVTFPDWANSPFENLSVRVQGIDSPEHRKPPAKCKKEVALGKDAIVFAKTLLKPGDKVAINYAGLDKYFRIDGGIVMPNGKDFAKAMIDANKARPYGGGKKSSWCH